MKLTHKQAVMLMIACTMMWSIAGVVTRYLDQAKSFEVTFWRSFFTLVSLFIILPLIHGKSLLSKFKQGGWYLWVSGVCWSIMFTAFMTALTMSSVANVLITLSLGPMLTALFARVFIGHKLPARTIIAIVVAGLGIAYMYAAQIDLSDLKQVAGMLVALGVPIAAAVNWTLVQHSQAHGHDVDLVPAVDFKSGDFSVVRAVSSDGSRCWLAGHVGICAVSYSLHFGRCLRSLSQSTRSIAPGIA